MLNVSHHENLKDCLIKSLGFLIHYNGANNCLFLNGTEIIKFKAKDFEINSIPLCLGNNSKQGNKLLQLILYQTFTSI